jgi:hypothetical protein
MSLGEMLGFGLAIGGILVTVGVQLGQLATLRERVSSLEQSREKQGERIGAIERRTDVSEAVARKG